VSEQPAWAVRMARPIDRVRGWPGVGAVVGLTGGPAGWLAVLTLAMSVGLVVVSVGITLARLDLPGGLALFWLGLVIVVLPAAVRLMTDSATHVERLGLVIGVGLALYLVKLMHSPIGFTFYDELLHWATLDDIVRTGRVFQENALLPISPSFPGLEIATSALVDVTGLSYFVAGALLIGIARVIVVVALFLFIERVADSPRMAGIATFVYMCNPSFVFFDAQYAYESLALGFAFVALLAVARRAHQPLFERRAWTVVASIAIAACIVTHHVTTYALIVFLALWQLISSFRGRRRTTPDGPGWLAVGTFLAAGAWVALVASVTVRYLGTPLVDAVNGLIQLAINGTGGRTLFQAGSGTIAPLWERATGIAAALILSAAIPFGLWHLWRVRPSRPAMWVLALGAAYPATVALRLTSAGQQASTRSSALIFVGLGFLIALAVTPGLVAPGRLRRQAALALAAGVVFSGGIISGWPPFGRLPGPYLVEADPRSIDAEGVAAADWARDTLGEGNRIAADRINNLLMGSYGRQRVVWYATDQVDLSPVFLDPVVGDAERAILRQGRVQDLVADRRLTTALPELGYYFDPGTSPADAAPMPVADFDKFDRTPGISRVFDSGDIQIYDVSALSDGP
jgi:hypothetical protein